MSKGREREGITAPGSDKFMRTKEKHPLHLAGGINPGIMLASTCLAASNIIDTYAHSEYFLLWKISWQPLLFSINLTRLQMSTERERSKSYRNTAAAC
jgi:hypothetical protein